MYLVSGAAGFIGSHVAEYLARKYPQSTVVAVDRLDYCASVHNVSDLCQLEVGDIADPTFTQHLFEKYAITHVVHCAASSHVDDSFKAPVKCVENNISTTQCLMQAARDCPSIKTFLHFSTDEVYGSVDFHADESAPLAPTNPYSASKAACDLLAQTYGRCYGLPVIITRCNNVYGPQQYPDKIIPKFIMRLLHHKPCTIHGTGENIRSYVHTLDVARAVDLVLHSGAVGEIYNIGSTNEVSNNQLAQLLVDEIAPDWKEGAVEHVPDRILNDRRYNINFDKIKTLGWYPQVNFQAGLRETIEWYREHGESQWDSVILQDL